jgi:hypothetical protein
VVPPSLLLPLLNPMVGGLSPLFPLSPPVLSSPVSSSR